MTHEPTLSTKKRISEHGRKWAQAYRMGDDLYAGQKACKIGLHISGDS